MNCDISDRYLERDDDPAAEPVFQPHEIPF